MFTTELIPHQEFLFGEGGHQGVMLGAMALTVAHLLVKQRPQEMLTVTVSDRKIQLNLDGAGPVPIDGMAREFLLTSLQSSGLNLLAGNGAWLQIIVRMSKTKKSRNHVHGDQIQDLDREKRRAGIQQRALRLAASYR